MTIYLLATLDTKGQEAEFLRARLRACGAAVTLVDTGVLGEPTVVADIPRDEVLSAAGASLLELVARADRGEAVAAMASGVAALVRAHYDAGKVAGVLGIGGSAGSTIGSAAMRALPLGVPKLLVSTLASGQVRHYVADKDIVMLNAVVDIAGLNRISRTILDGAARAMAGLATFSAAPREQHEKPLVAATMFGVTTPCVARAREILEAAGYEVLVFHATGSGGQAMESLIADGQIAGVLDLTTTELADELVGGVLSAGPDRLTAAARCGVPQVVSVGATDMVNFHARETVPAKFHERKFYQHNASVTLMRTTVDECRQIGAEIGRKLAGTRAVILLPAAGVSAIDRAGQPFDAPVARQALMDAIAETATGVEIITKNCHINDPEFAEAAAARLMALMREAGAHAAKPAALNRSHAKGSP